jgi:hypothetical protein
MKKLITTAAVLNLAIPVLCLSQETESFFGIIEWTAKESERNYDIESNFSEIASDSTLSIVFIGREGKYEIIRGDEVIRGEFPGAGREPEVVRVSGDAGRGLFEAKGLPQGGCSADAIKKHYYDTQGKTVNVTNDNYINIERSKIKEGDTIVVSYWPKGHPQGRDDFVMTATKFGYKWLSISNLALTPLVNIEIGKKNEENEKVTDGTPAGGVQYLFFYKAREHKLLDNIGWGFNNSYTKTELWNEETQKMEDTVVATLGVALAYKPDSLPIFFTGGAGYNLNGPDKFLQVMLGLGTLAVQ